MEAGQELDATVAEKVMGQSPRAGKIIQRDGSRVTEIRELPHYSTRIEDAWAVVDRIHKQGHPLAPFRELWKDDADLADMPRLICLAALKAVGG